MIPLKNRNNHELPKIKFKIKRNHDDRNLGKPLHMTKYHHNYKNDRNKNLTVTSRRNSPDLLQF